LDTGVATGPDDAVAKKVAREPYDAWIRSRSIPQALCRGQCLFGGEIAYGLERPESTTDFSMLVRFVLSGSPYLGRRGMESLREWSVRAMYPGAGYSWVFAVSGGDAAVPSARGRSSGVWMGFCPGARGWMNNVGMAAGR